MLTTLNDSQGYFFAGYGKKQVKQVYNDQPLGILALGKIGGGYGFLVSVVSRVCPWLPNT